jgi:coenzyme F420-0:L-glutamate ligase/coenzyme F420-1:gamma-L-glutamate ligase
LSGVAPELHVFALAGIPEITSNTDLAIAISEAVVKSQCTIEAGDVFVVAQKIVSKAEGAVGRLSGIVPSELASRWASAHGKDPALVEVVLQQSRRIVRMDRDVIISETHHGFVCANAGVDASNVEPGFVTILPRDPDQSASQLQQSLTARFGLPVATIIADTFGRPWREGVVNVALGVAGLQPLYDCRGRIDSHGRQLHSTVIAVADELACAAELVMGKTDARPVAVVRGAAEWTGHGSGAMLVRQGSLDLFR